MHYTGTNLIPYLPPAVSKTVQCELVACSEVSSPNDASLPNQLSLALIPMNFPPVFFFFFFKAAAP